MKKAAKRKISFIVAWCFLISAVHCEAQQGVYGKLPTLTARLVFDVNPKGSNHWVKSSKPVEMRSPLSLNAAVPFQALAADYYVQNIGFFCKREWEFEKKTHVPLKFRLGSLDYVNRLEGK